MARAARVAVGADREGLSAAQRALVLVTLLLVVVGLVLLARQGLGTEAGGDAAHGSRATAAPSATTTPLPTTAPASSIPAGASTGGVPIGAASPPAAPEGAGQAEQVTPDGSDATAQQVAVPPAPVGEATAAADAAPPAPVAPPADAAPPDAPLPTSTWYVSFDGGDLTDELNVDNVLAYDAGGTPYPSPVLTPGTTGLPLDLRELRGMAFGNDGTFYVVNSFKDDSKILAFGGAVGPDGTRALLGEFSHGYPTDGNNPGIQHPFGLAFDVSGNVLVSSQDSQVVTRLNGPVASSGAPGTPTATASNWCQTSECGFYPGTLVPGADAPDQPAPPPSTVGPASGGLKAPRGVAYVSGNNTVYVADSTDASVKAYDGTTGAFKGKVIKSSDGLAQPVGVAVHNGILYVTDETNNQVLGLDLITPDVPVQVVVKEHVGGVSLDHPSGLAFDADGALYVASRKGKQVERYELSGDGVRTTKAKVFLDHLPDEPEQIVAVPG